MMKTSPVNLRNLEQIHEGTTSQSPRVATLLLGGVGIAAVLVAVMAVRERKPASEPATKDPLAALVAEAARAKDAEESEHQVLDLDFPDILSDADARTTALVAVKDKKGRLIAAAQSPEAPAPVDVTDIPTVPLPAGSVLAATAVTREPKDELTQMAVQVSKIPDEVIPVASGSEGGFLVQVASFKNQDDAEAFVLDLRKRGHKAFRQAANVPNRGIWHRVRIGSFTTRYQAELYKKNLEKTERTIALVIDPAKVERQEQVRAAKLAERIRKYGARQR